MMTTKSIRNITRGGGALLTAVATMGYSCFAFGAAPGITDTEVVICDSHPMSGPASAWGADTFGSKAFFSDVNKAGGVKMADGKTRKIKYIVYDDSYTPQKAVANARRCVDSDHVFAMYGTLGTSVNAAIVDYMNSHKTPQVYIASGALWTGDIAKHPWTLPWNLPYVAEGGIYGRYIASTNPKAKVVVLKQGDSFGDEYFEGFKKALDEKGIKITEVETYDPGTPSIDSQLIKLASTKADVLFLAAAPKYATQAIAKKGELGWNATTVVSVVSSSIGSVLEPAGLDNAKGVITAAVVKDPSDSRWDGDADMKKYKASTQAYGYDPLDAFVARGYSIAATFVKALEGTAAPSQDAFMKSVRNMDYAAPLLLPGVRIVTSPTDGFAVESAQLQRFDGSKWVPFGDVVSFEGKTLEAGK